ncbi:MAG: hypothetical protein FWG87_06065 [Defluviitaleaceae bacterium]|nr:hypothetical protein [Defluviitaleaceae bacterium]
MDSVKKDNDEIKQLRILTKSKINTSYNKLLKDRGFKRYKSNQYINVTEQHIIQIVMFEFLSCGFTCAVAMQPLYIQDHTEFTCLHLNFGDRITRFKTVQKEAWEYHEHEEGIRIIRELLNKNVFPWFEEYGTPKGIVEFISSGGMKKYGLFDFNKFFEYQYLGFSLLYTNQAERGIGYLERMIDEIRNDSVTSMRDYKFHIVDLISRIKKSPNNTINALNDIIIRNRLSLNL